MANQFVSLPTPAGNGSGAAVDVSTFGGVKTVTNSGNGFSLEPSVTIEFSNELVPTRFAPLWTFGKPGERSVVVGARWMRATVSNYRGGGAPVIDVGGNDFNTSFATLVATAGSGTGVAVDVSALPNFKTIHVSGQFRGALNIEISEDGGASFSQIATFYAPGYKSLTLVAEFMRVTRNGVPVNSPGLPAINIGATVGGGGDSAGIEVADEGVALPGGPFGTVNFVGAGVTATDGGGGVATITIPGAGSSGILFWGIDNIGAAADTRFIPPGHDIGLASTTDRFAMPAPRAGTLRNLFVRHNSASGNGNAVAYTVIVNGVATTITVALASGAVGQVGDLANSVVVAQGDRISLRATKDVGIAAGVIDLQASLEIG